MIHIETVKGYKFIKDEYDFIKTEKLQTKPAIDLTNENYLKIKYPFFKKENNPEALTVFSLLYEIKRKGKMFLIFNNNPLKDNVIPIFSKEVIGFKKLKSSYQDKCFQNQSFIKENIEIILPYFIQQLKLKNNQLEFSSPNINLEILQEALLSLKIKSERTDKLIIKDNHSLVRLIPFLSQPKNFKVKMFLQKVELKYFLVGMNEFAFLDKISTLEKTHP